MREARFETGTAPHRIVDVVVGRAFERIQDGPLVMVLSRRAPEILKARRRQRRSHPLGSHLLHGPIRQIGLVPRLRPGLVAGGKVALELRPNIVDRSISTQAELLALP